MNRRAGSAYSSSSGHSGSAERRVPRSAAEHPRQHGGERRRGRLAHRLIQRRERQRLPQHLPQARGLAVVDQPLLHRLARRRRDARGRLPFALALCSACAMRIGPASRSAASRSRQPSASQSSSPPTKIERRRQRRQAAAGCARPARSTKSTSRLGCTRTRSSVPICRRNANVSCSTRAARAGRCRPVRRSADR